MKINATRSFGRVAARLCATLGLAGALSLTLPARADARQLKLLVFGDSLAAGYGLPYDEGFEPLLQGALRKDGRDVQILEGGVSGDTTAGGKARLDWALAGKPDAVLLELGANDALRATDPKVTEANLTAMLDNLESKHIPVLLSGMLAPPNLGPAYGAQFREVYQKLSHRPGVMFDLFFLQGVAGDPTLVQGDRLHPNAEGVRRIVARILPLVEKLLDRIPQS